MERLLNVSISEYREIKNWYWNDLAKKQGIKGKNYDKYKFCDSKHIIMLGYEYPHINLGIKWIIRLRCGYIYNSKIAYKSGKVSKECPSYCPCCQQGEQSFEHWIFDCPFFSLIRWNSLDFINDLFITFADKIKRHSLYNNYTSILEYEKNISIIKYIYSFLVELQL